MSIITNKRIVDIEQPRLLERRVTECQLEQIRDVRYNTQGIVSLFDIGTVLIDFGNERGYLACRTVRHPRELQQFILTARQHHTKYSQSIQDEEL